MAKRKRKRKRRTSRYKGIGLSSSASTPVVTQQALRDKYPKKLIEAFVKVSLSGWTDAMYKKYVKQVKAYLGKNKYKDPIENGRLIVLLSGACRDLTDVAKKKQKELLKMTCKEHLKYRAMRVPRSGCKKCLDIYNVKKQKTTTKKAAKKKTQTKKKKGS